MQTLRAVDMEEVGELVEASQRGLVAEVDLVAVPAAVEQGDAGLRRW